METKVETKENQEPEKKSLSIGVLLKTSRERKGQTLESVTNALRIRLKHLNAIEQGKYEDLPGKTYAIGFVKSYAEYLGLDGDEIVRLFKEEVAELKKKQEFYVIDAGSEASIPSYLMVLIAFVIAGSVYLFSANKSDVVMEDVKTSDEIPQEIVEIINNQIETPEIIKEEIIPQPLENIAAEEVAVNPSVSLEKPAVIDNVVIKEVEFVAPVAETSAPTATSAPVVENVAKQETVVNKIEPAAEQKNETIENKEIVSENQETAKKERVSQNYGQENIGSRIVIKASSESWVQVVGEREGEKIIFISKVLYPNDTYTLPNRTDLVLDTGNAGGLDIFVDGNKVEPVGKMGAVRRGVLLTPEKLLEKAAGSASQQN